MNPLDVYPGSEVHDVYMAACATRDRIGVMIATDLARGDTPPVSRLDDFRDAQITVIALDMFQDRMLEREQKS